MHIFVATLTMPEVFAMSVETPTDSRPHLIPVTEWPKHHSWPPLGGLRHLIFYAESNGFDRVIKRVGRRVLIDEAKFFEWVDAQNAEKGGGS